MTYFLLLFLFSTFFSACLFYLLPISRSFFFFFLLHSRASMAPPIATMSFISLSLRLSFLSFFKSFSISAKPPWLHHHSRSSEALPPPLTMAEPIQAETTMVKLPKLFLYSQPISNSFLLSFFISPLLIFFLSPAKNPSLRLVVYVWFCGDCIWFKFYKSGILIWGSVSF